MMKKPRGLGKIAAVLLAAAAVFSLTGTSAFADSGEAISEETAQEAALREIETLKSMGILSEDVEFSGDADEVYESSERIGDDYWFGRVFPHRYEVRWNFQRDCEEKNYGGNICVDAESGKLSHFTINAAPGTDAVPVREEDWGGLKVSFYDNYDDIFPADMTVDRFCSLLAEYLGFTGYTLSDTNDGFYQQEWKAVSGDTLLKEMPLENYYLTVYFDGDQEDVPMYVQIACFPGYVTLFAGTGHAVG